MKIWSKWNIARLPLEIHGRVWQARRRRVNIQPVDCAKIGLSLWWWHKAQNWLVWL